MVRMLKQLYSQLAGPGFRGTFARVVAGSAFAQIFGMGLALLVSMVLARTLGPQHLGIYSLAMSTIAVLGIPTEFGLPTYLVREAATAHVRHDWGHLRAVVAWCTRAVVLAGLAVIVFVALALLFLGEQVAPQLRATIIAALPLVLFVAITKTREAAMQGMNLQPLAQIPMLVLRPGFFLVALLIVSLAGMSFGPPGAMVLHSGATALVAVVITVSYSRNLKPLPEMATTRIDGGLAVRAALPMAMTEGLRVLNGHVAIFMLGFLADSRAVGLFKVADAIGIMCALPVWILNNVTAPLIARLHAANDVVRLRKLVSYVALGMTVGSFAVALIVLCVGEEILRLLFGAAFAEARASMLVLCFGHALSAVLGPSAAYMNMTGREQLVARSIAVSFTANIVIGSLAITYTGVIGAAIANVASSFVWNGWLWWEARRHASVDTSILPAALELLSARPILRG